MQIKLDRHDLAIMTDALVLFQPSDPDRAPTFRETSQLFQDAEPEQALDLTTTQLL